MAKDASDFDTALREDSAWAHERSAAPAAAIPLRRRVLACLQKFSRTISRPFAGLRSRDSSAPLPVAKTAAARPFAKGDVVRLTGGRDARTTVVNMLSEDRSLTRLRDPLGGSFHWNVDDLEHAGAHGQ